jgi:hypothetical protein
VAAALALLADSPEGEKLRAFLADFSDPTTPSPFKKPTP